MACTEVTRLRRMLRALLRQQGGVMVTTLPASRIAVRMECSISGREVIVTVHGNYAALAGIVQSARGAMQAECDRAGCRATAIACETPAEVRNRAA